VLGRQTRDSTAEQAIDDDVDCELCSINVTRRLLLALIKTFNNSYNHTKNVLFIAYVT